MERPNPIVTKKKKSKKGPSKITPIVDTPKGSSRKKVVIPYETPMRRSPRMRGHTSKVSVEVHSTSSKPSTKESLVQIVSDNSSPHPETANIPEKP